MSSNKDNSSTNQALWSKGDLIDEAVHKFTVGNDPITDLNFIFHDCIASAAHAKMLTQINILNKEELPKLLDSLKNISELSLENKFKIEISQEDCHTAIESFLVKELGDIGKKIHTGRSRNDQVLVATRLYLRKSIVAILNLLASNVKKLREKSLSSRDIIMPGYTHYQRAMPTTFSVYLSAYSEMLIDCIKEGVSLFNLINVNPLGAGSGFGVNFPLNRELTTQYLNFNSTERNPIHIQNNRGRFEKKFASWCSDIFLVIEKISCDLILFSTDEFGFINIPKKFTTGSSIMPQKHNPDVLELLRGYASTQRSNEIELTLITSKLPSSYHRDFQLTKEPMVRSFNLTNTALLIIEAIIPDLSTNIENIKKALTPELYATYEANKLVREGMAFRDAYKKTAELLKENKIKVEDLKSEIEYILDTEKNEFAVQELELKDILQKIALLNTQITEAENNIFKA